MLRTHHRNCLSPLLSPWLCIHSETSSRLFLQAQAQRHSLHLLKSSLLSKTIVLVMETWLIENLAASLKHLKNTRTKLSVLKSKKKADLGLQAHRSSRYETQVAMHTTVLPIQKSRNLHSEIYRKVSRNKLRRESLTARIFLFLLSKQLPISNFHPNLIKGLLPPKPWVLHNHNCNHSSHQLGERLCKRSKKQWVWRRAMKTPKDTFLRFCCISHSAVCPTAKVSPRNQPWPNSGSQPRKAAIAKNLVASNFIVTASGQDCFARTHASVLTVRTGCPTSRESAFST